MSTLFYFITIRLGILYDRTVEKLNTNIKGNNIILLPSILNQNKLKICKQLLYEKLHWSKTIYCVKSRDR